MFEARVIEISDDKKSGDDKAGDLIRVEDYCAENHRGRLLCADFRCAARLYHRDAARAFGDVKLRVPHFATFPHDRHRDDCTHHNPDAEEKNMRNMRGALAAGQNILINLNMDVGLSLGDVFARVAEPAQAETPYGRFLRRGHYFAVSARSVNDVLRYRRALLRSGYEDVLRRTYVGHKHELRKFENFFIGAEKEKLKTLFNSLSKGEGVMLAGPQKLVTGFPRVIKFVPTEKTQREGLRRGKINGTSQWMGRPGGHGFVLLQNLGLEDGKIRRDIIENEATYILAAPTIDRGPRKDDKYAIMNWRVINESQYAVDIAHPPITPKLL